jgi:hypothetical protein
MPDCHAENGKGHDRHDESSSTQWHHVCCIDEQDHTLWEMDSQQSLRQPDSWQGRARGLRR